MSMKKYCQILLFLYRAKTKTIASSIRQLVYRLIGFKIGSKTKISNCKFTWPHKVSIGSKTIIEHDVFFKFDGPWSNEISIIIGDEVFIGNHCEFNCNTKIEIKDYCNIASGCKFIDHDHGIKREVRIGAQPSLRKEIILEEDVWLGVNTTVLKGVTIGKGAVVAAGAVVNKNIPPYEIWGGIPAKKLGERK